MREKSMVCPSSHLPFQTRTSMVVTGPYVQSATSVHCAKCGRAWAEEVWLISHEKMHVNCALKKS